MTRPSLTLGVCAYTHDSSAALFSGTSLTGFLEEDRLTDEKHTRRFPALAVEQLLQDVGATPENVDHVAYTFSSPLYAEGRAAAQRFPGPTGRAAQSVASYDAVAAQHQRTLAELRVRFPNAQVHEVAHHVAHALCGIATNQWVTSDVLVVDSIGEGSTTSIGHWDGNNHELRIEALATDTHSLGYVYGALTDHLGFRMRDEEGTVMALAAFGDPTRFREALRRTFWPGVRGAPTVSPTYLRQRVFGDSGPRLTDTFARETLPRRRPGEPLSEPHCDLAAALQERTEDVLCALARNIEAEHTAVVGGVAANCVGIGRLRRDFPITRFFVPPAPGDSGTPIGAGAAVLLKVAGQLADVPSTPYLGPVPQLPTITQLVQRDLPRCAEHSEERLAQMIAERLAAGEIVGVFRGRAEAGPRALGNRSILANPAVEAIDKRLALRVKKREAFRPFAPIATDDDASSYVDLDGGHSPYMSVALTATPLLTQVAPVAVHRNGTTRMQTVPRGANPFIEAVLANFKRLTGIGVLLNTSFNSKGHPTVGHWTSALAYLTEMDLDAVVIGNLLVPRQ
ncbi:transferase [Mycobacterium lentiflavum]|uniref:Transferase n=1 Tax=Mycobacterium lentiflavum TaxID=141349 RepID=A0A0E4CR54_MYCLN|nr:carbamoyltransferase C-terminal domain-containing protein [Mycobacterium lentiflavum]CQD22886.1 transferase [Mycobacterium lentiflavum]